MSDYRDIPVASLTIDKRYQRPLDERRVKKIAKDFNPRLLGSLEVAERKGGKWAVFDGQHRLAALKVLAEPAAPCRTHTGLSAQEEAELFVALQVERRNINHLDRFNARVFSGDKVARHINRLVEAAGFRIGYQAAGGSRAIRAVSTLERLYEKDGPDGLAGSLDSLHVWNGDPKVTDGQLLEGVAILRRGYLDRLTDESWAKLAEVAPSVILRRAHGNAAGGGGWSAQFVAVELRKISGVRGRPANAR